MKKIISREEFETLRRSKSKEMAKDEDLIKSALDVKVKAGHDYYWVHQTNWMGEPCLQLVQDMFAMQEVIFKSKPTYIVECGVAWGGTTLFLASVLKLIGGKKVIGLDIFIPEDLKSRLKENPLSDMIELIEGSTVDIANFFKVKSMVGLENTMVILDSNHTHEHVLKELRLYSQIVKVGQYLICGDTSIERQPPAPERPRDWGKGNNPWTALKEFEKECTDFEVDHEIEDKLLMTNNPGGYLKRVKD